MKRLIGQLKSAACIICAAALCGCSEIPNAPSESAVATAEALAETAEAAESGFDEIPAKEYSEDTVDVLMKLNAEGGAFDGSVRTDGEYDGNGYIVLDEGMTLTHIADLPSSQHYRVVLAVHAYEAAVISLCVQNECAGEYYVPISQGSEYEFVSVDNLYLAAGPAVLKFVCESGSAAVDYILIESSDKVSSDAYRISSTAVSSNSTLAAIGTMKYLSDIYGKNVLIGQNVTPGTNAELDAVLSETGRSPAIRCGELALITLDDEDSVSTMQTERELACEWAEKGGLISYTWHWYAPDSKLTRSGSFDLTAALEGSSLDELALMNGDEIAALYENGYISEDMLYIINSIDAAAEYLKSISDEDIPIIWQPLPDSDTELYWWGDDVESFVSLWRFMFTRFCSFHSLGNLIWVYNGSSADFYPGDSYCDIIGQSIYESSSASFAGRFAALSRLSDTETKALAITACDTLPSPDYMLRDNAMWLWFAIASGDSIINTDGSLSEAYTGWQSLYNAYNSEICITLDELPDFTEYAFSG